MYRKSVDYGLTQNLHTIEYNSFRRKGEHVPQFIVEDELLQQFRIKRNHNTLITILVIADLLNQKSPISKKVGQKIFQGFSADYIPKLFYNYQHEETLQQLWNVIKNKTKTLPILADQLVNNTIVQFVMQCFGRKIIHNFLEANNSQIVYNLHGNQMDVLADYSMELRGNLIHFLALAFKLEVSLKYKDSSSHIEEVYTQHFGESTAHNRVQIWVDNEFYKVSLTLGDQLKLVSTQSTQIIYSIKKQKQGSLDTTGEGSRHPQSKSANKDNLRCLKCRGKVCQCQKSKKGMTPRTNNSSNLQISRGIFESTGLSSSFKRQTSNQELVKK